jgi:uncharacterized protein (TIGR03545 family)
MKKIKIPGIYKATLSPKKLEKIVSRRIHLPKEKDFFRSLYTLEDDGRFHLRDIKEKQTVTHMKKLAKAIKKSKGIITGWKAAIILVPTTALLIFSMVFKNSLIERGIERSLESVFGARVEMEGLQVSLISGSFSFSALSVADQRQPMRNLFELGPSIIALDSGELMKKKLVLKQFESRSILFGTERSSSGALEKAEIREEKQSQQERLEQAEAAVDVLEDLAMESGQVLLDRYQAGLSSPEILAEANSTLAQLPEKWEEQLDRNTSVIRNISTEGRNVIEQDPRNFRSATEIGDYISSIRELEQQIGKAAQELEDDIDSIGKDIEEAEAYGRAIEEAIALDREFLRNSVRSFGTDAADAVSGTAERMVREKFSNIIPVAERGIELYDRIGGQKKNSEEEAEKRREVKRQGENINFSGPGYPDFLLESFLVEFGMEEEPGYISLAIRDLSSEPEAWGQPATVVLDMVNETARIGSTLRFIVEEGSIVNEGSLNMQGLPISGAGIAALGLAAFEATGRGELEFSLDNEGSGRMGGLISLTDPSYSFTEEESLITRASQSVFEELEIIDLGIHLALDQWSIASIAVESDLDRQIGRALSSFGQEEASRQGEALLADFSDSLAEQTEQFRGYSEELDELQDSLQQEKRSAEAFEKLLEEKRKEAEGQIQSLEDKAQEEIRSRVEEEGNKTLESIGGRLGF